MPPSSPFFPERSPLPNAVSTHAFLRESIRVADAALAAGHHPFGCILVGPAGDVLLEQGNLDTVNHAELTLARAAAARYEPPFLWRCTVVTNFEPCCMWASKSNPLQSCFLRDTLVLILPSLSCADIGWVIYGAPESALLSLTGSNSENPTLALPCRTVFAAGSKDIQVIGPVPEMEEAVLASHKTFWQAVGTYMHQ